MKVIFLPSEPPKTYGIYGNIVSQKGDPDILETSEDSIQERFGLGDNDPTNQPGYSGDGSVYPFRDEN